ncbi:DBIRD complex subunit ZNF326-like [Bombina bombina]|uniref:DBIRD complex subunit ZNF326-like n=1 Tax=Bombina bombina TaxID=8345 RepID=UPI00235AD6C6|nr:DBIRD complex subunit ZNF326-like [Bombina bombina]
MATDILEGVTPQDHMEEVKSVHCNACNLNIHYVYPSVQSHIKSRKHIKNREEYRMHIKKQSVHIASTILKNPTVSARYELYLKGENPFDTQDDQVDVTVESDDNAESEESDSEETAAMPTDE